MHFSRVGAALACFIVCGCAVDGARSSEPLERSVHPSSAPRFEENRGQFPPDVRFVARTAQGWLRFSDHGVSFLRVAGCTGSSMRAVPIELEGARWRDARGEGEAAARVHYVRAPSVTDVRLFESLRYVDVLPDTDLVFRSRPDGVDYVFERRDGRPAALSLTETGGAQTDAFAMGTTVRGLGDWDTPVPLSPYRMRATFLGGTGCEALKTVAFAPDGKIVVAGSAFGPGFPTMGGAYDSVATASETYVARFSSDLTTLDAVTFVGNAGTPAGVAVDAQGDVYVATSTWTAGLPTTVGAAQRTNAGSDDVYIAKLAGDLRSLRYATYLGGPDADGVEGLALDPFRREVYVTGYTSGGRFPIIGGPSVAERGPRGGSGPDVFVAKLNAAGSSFAFATTLGGSAYDMGRGIAVDAVGGVYVTGDTSSTDFPVRGAAQPTKGASYDAFLVKLTDTGSAVSYATFYGGAGDDHATAVAVDDVGRPVIVGLTIPIYGATSPSLPLRNAVQPNYGGGYDDGFVARLVATGASLDFATYLGGSDADTVDGVAIDPTAKVHVIGHTSSNDLPTTSPIQATRAGQSDHFVTVLSATGMTRSMSTYLGGSDSEWLYSAIAVRDGRIAFASMTGSTNYPVAPNAFDTVFSNTRGCYPGEGIVGVIDNTLGPPLLTSSVKMEAVAYSAPEYLGSATVAVTRSGFLGGAVSVDLVTIPDTATATTDYTPVTTTVNFAAGQARVAISIPLRIDGLAEWNERFYVVLRRPVGASLAQPSSAAVTIVDGVPQ